MCLSIFILGVLSSGVEYKWQPLLGKRIVLPKVAAKSSKPKWRTNTQIQEIERVYF